MLTQLFTEHFWAMWWLVLLSLAIVSSAVSSAIKGVVDEPRQCGLCGMWQFRHHTSHSCSKRSPSNCGGKGDEAGVRD